MNKTAQKRAPGTASETLLPQLWARTVIVPTLNLGVAPDMLQLSALFVAPYYPPARNGYSSLSGLTEAPAAAVGRVIVLGVVEVPADQPLTTGLDMARSYRALLDFLPSQIEVAGSQVRVDRMVKVAREVAVAVREAALAEKADLVLLHWKGYAREPKRHLYGRIMDEMLNKPACDIVVARPEGWRASRRILLPVRGGPSAERGLEIGVRLAEHLHLPLTVMHNVPVERAEKDGDNHPMNSPPAISNVEALGEEPYIAFNGHLKRMQGKSRVRIERILTSGEDTAGALLAEARADDLMILGAPASAEGEAAEPSLGPIVRKVSEEKGLPLLVVRACEAIDLTAYGEQAKKRRPGRKGWEDLSFEHWFVENTYHGDEFKDADEFLKAKAACGLSISVALLTSNDAAHLYSTLTGLKRVLREMHPLADQIAVIDAGSSDGTVDIARSLGVEVFEASSLLPRQGSLHGRGESLWKSLSVLWGDVVVWLDPRAQRFHPSTALSLAGPLLKMPHLQIVKAFEPFQPEKSKRGQSEQGEGEARDGFSPVDMSWGGFVVPRRQEGFSLRRVRVQALKPSDLETLTPTQMATLPPRTILQVLYPALAGVIAPFGHDTAARREAMLDVPIFAGENMDLGLLLSIAAEYGSGAIAQVELRHAQPAPHPQPGLRNAIDVLQVLARRLPDQEMRRCAAETAERLQHGIEGPTSGPSVEVRALGPVERSPIGRVLKKF